MSEHMLAAIASSNLYMAASGGDACVLFAAYALLFFSSSPHLLSCMIVNIYS